jgi:hypothetical protein
MDLPRHSGEFGNGCGIKCSAVKRAGARSRTPAQVALWNFTEYVRGAILLSNCDKNFDQAMNTVVGRMRSLISPVPSPTDAVQK